MFFDTHCHLNSEGLYEQLDSVLKDARNKGVSFFNVVGYDYKSSVRALKIASTNDDIVCSLGIHPCDIDGISEQEFTELERMLKSNKVVAVGEIGLDYYWIKDLDARERQKDFFIRQINLANKLKLPIVIHSRDALEDTYTILKNNQPHYGGVMHCYSGSKEMLKNFLELGLYISLAGPVTFLNAVTPKEIAFNVPLDKLLIETDSPYLTPHPHRGKKNNPGYIQFIAEAIANIKNISVEEVAKCTKDNGNLLFHVKQYEK